MRLDPADITDLQPLIAAAVRAALEEIRADETKLAPERLSYSEAEAAELLGLPGAHVLRDLRRRGEVECSRLGRRPQYTREQLLKLLHRTREAAR